MLRIPFDKKQRANKRYATEKDIEELLSCEIVIDEKFDGSIVSFTREGTDIVAYGRRNEIMRNGILTNRNKAYILLDDWYWKHEENLKQIPCGYTIFGEWLYAKHTIFYDKLPDYWMCFDIFNGKEFMYFLSDEYWDISEKINLWMLPRLEIGMFSINGLKRVAQKKESVYGSRMEGYVAKNYEKQIFMKFVNHEFDIDLEENGHWLKQPLEINKLSNYEI